MFKNKENSNNFINPFKSTEEGVKVWNTYSAQRNEKMKKKLKY